MAQAQPGRVARDIIEQTMKGFSFVSSFSEQRKDHRRIKFWIARNVKAIKLKSLAQQLADKFNKAVEVEIMTDEYSPYKHQSLVVRISK